FVQRGVESRVELAVRRTQRKGERLCGSVVFDELLRLSLLIQVFLEPPALETSAAVRENGDDIPSFDADISLGALANDCRRLSDGLRYRCRCRWRSSRGRLSRRRLGGRG